MDKLKDIRRCTNWCTKKLNSLLTKKYVVDLITSSVCNILASDQSFCARKIIEIREQRIAISKQFAKINFQNASSWFYYYLVNYIMEI